jgi:hypothetical protein
LRYDGVHGEFLHFVQFPRPVVRLDGSCIVPIPIVLNHPQFLSSFLDPIDQSDGARACSQVQGRVSGNLVFLAQGG